MIVLDYSVVRDHPQYRDLDGDDLRDLSKANLDEQAHVFAATVLRSRSNRAVLERLSGLDIPPWQLTAGCLFQTVWNVASGYGDLSTGIRDHDLFFFESGDLSYEAEDRVLRRCVQACEGLDVELEPRNEARVHLWYEAKFGKKIRPYRDLEDAIRSFAATCCCVGLHLDSGGKLTVTAPFGFEDLFNLVLRPNPEGVAPRAVYETKTDRWRQIWPSLTKLPWNENA
ncbi:nucleotidyltransferase family protein [Actinacidiphila glaucinigra]|uniref:nucleotidyltransferase family protein n=1 Tax=Actinacidiphila glaucinigra TaxID=235986 RepID=UPI002DDAB596|nr:nucleotidyltransferase family protein [Actinacidiphila glaucinigra]WSD65061.1 nucleotidyltransferase family protein [Actinacidiphila glaucinigra]